MLEIYKENLFDLLNSQTSPSQLKIKEHPKNGVYIENLSKEYITNIEELLSYIEQADIQRVTAETGLNKTSSRSHLLFILEIIQKLPDCSERIGTLNMVDLAGSEKVILTVEIIFKISKTNAQGETLEEAKKINLSLMSLGKVINCLTSGNGEYIPYKDSKLTRILKDSLGGNFKTTLIVTCSPHAYNIDETVGTLNFAKRAKKIKNLIKANIKKSSEELEQLICLLQQELKKAKDEIISLKSQSGNQKITTNLNTNTKIENSSETDNERFNKTLTLLRKLLL